MHHDLFSASSPEGILEEINTCLSQVHCSIHELGWLMLAFGAACIYEQEGTRQVVSSCRKLPESCFNRRILSVDEVANEYTSLIISTVARNSHLRILFTVSLIRYICDGMYVNQLGKSILLLAIDRLQQLFPDHVFHLPSYEIVLDELCDYRYYTDNILYPSPLAVRYLWEHFSEAFFPAETKQVVTTIGSIIKDLPHKPSHPGLEAYQRFLGQIVLKIE